MEVSLFEKERARLASRDGVENVTLKDGTVIKAAHIKDATFRVPVTGKMLSALESVGLTPTANVGSNLHLVVSVGFPANAGQGFNKGYLDACIFNQYILTSSCSAVSDDTKINVTIGYIKGTWNHRSGSSKIYFLPAVPSYSFRLISQEGGEKQSLNVSTGNDGSQWRPISWIGGASSVDWDIICSAKLLLPTAKGPEISASDPLVLNRRMLTEELYSDVVVIAKNKGEVKFHRCVMAAHSSVFNAMFQSVMAEAQTGMVDMPDMTEEGVRNLREFLYLGTLEAAMENPQVCCELLEAGHKYDIQTLENSMKTILLQKPHDWYSVDVALRLFLFERVRGEEGLEMKMKAVRILTTKHQEFKASPSYQKLFKKNPDASMDLYECLAEHFN